MEIVVIVSHNVFYYLLFVESKNSVVNDRLECRCSSELKKDLLFFTSHLITVNRESSASRMEKLNSSQPFVKKCENY